MVLGDVTNQGELRVYGMIQGGLRDPDGRAHIDSGAVIRGRIESPAVGT